MRVFIHDSFPITHGHFKIDFCDVILNALYEYLVSFLGSIDARTWRGYRLYGPRMGPIDNFSLAMCAYRGLGTLTKVCKLVQMVSERGLETSNVVCT